MLLKWFWVSNTRTWVFFFNSIYNIYTKSIVAKKNISLFLEIRLNFFTKKLHAKLPQ